MAGFLVAASGFGIGALLAWLFRLEKSQIIAVSIETAIQNSAIALLVLQTSLDPPFNDIASIAPIAQIIIVGIPLWLLILAIQIRRRLCLKTEQKAADLNHDERQNSEEVKLLAENSDQLPEGE